MLWLTEEHFRLLFAPAGCDGIEICVVVAYEILRGFPTGQEADEAKHGQQSENGQQGVTALTIGGANGVRAVHLGYRVEVNTISSNLLSLNTEGKLAS